MRREAESGLCEGLSRMIGPWRGALLPLRGRRSPCGVPGVRNGAQSGCPDGCNGVDATVCGAGSPVAGVQRQLQRLFAVPRVACLRIRDRHELPL